MSNWYTDKLCDECGAKIATNGNKEWCEGYSSGCGEIRSLDEIFEVERIEILKKAKYDVKEAYFSVLNLKDRYYLKEDLIQLQAKLRDCIMILNGFKE